MGSIDNSHQYTLARDVKGTTRLTAQHYLWNSVLGFDVHPDIPALAPGARVADVATGTGAWLFDVAQANPQASFDGFDVSLTQCPPAAWLPQNVSLHQWDFFKEPPLQFQGQFDFVHVRLVTVVIKHNDPTIPLRNFAKLLKPGGYLQWDEMLHKPVEAIAADARHPKAGYSYVHRLYKDVEGWSVDDTWKLALPDHCKALGFQQAQSHQYDESYAQRPWNIRAFTAININLANEFIEMTLQPGTRAYDEARKKMAAFTAEAAQGTGFVAPPLICVARKALS